MHWKYLLFDLDGTLTDPMQGITRSVQYALRHFGIEVEDLTTLCPFIGPPLRGQFCKVCGLADEESARMVEDYREYYRDKGIFGNNVYDGVIEMLEKLRKKGFRLAIATSKPEMFAKQIADYFGFSKYFDFIGGACMNESRTDKYEVIEYVIESCNITDRNEVVMVGDRSHDMIGAKKAGLHSIGVLYGYGSKEELEQSGAEMLVEVPEQIVSLMEV